MHLKKATESLIHNRGKREKSEREAAIMHHGSSLFLSMLLPLSAQPVTAMLPLCVIVASLITFKLAKK